MEYDEDKVDDMVLALLYLTSFKDGGLTRAWKGVDWDALNRLCDKGYISDPKRRAKSVVLTEKGRKRSQELFGMYFGRSGGEE